MKTKADRLLEQFHKVRDRAGKLLKASGCCSEAIIYAFATDKTLIINCRNLETAWQLEENQNQLWQAILDLKPSINQILIEKNGQVLYAF
ncbi:MAG: hypothetical protein VKK07_01475 [Merismopediaceae bacterium]|nr:hypothetical protein [Merismopediaceae bacterium]